MTNADKYFRQATDEEIAEFLCAETSCCDCKFLLSGLCGNGNGNPWLNWLKQEA